MPDVSAIGLLPDLLYTARRLILLSVMLRQPTRQVCRSLQQLKWVWELKAFEMNSFRWMEDVLWCNLTSLGDRCII